jgi:TfoX/Sxy family transcriptional regulator of competence genes
MAYDEDLAARVRRVLARRRGVTEKKMFGGLAFMVGGNMCCGIVRDELMVRVGPERYEEALTDAHVRPMDFTGRPMKGMIFVEAEGCRADKDLERWVGLGVDLARSLPAKPR